MEDWNDLRFVLAAHRAGSVTEAARAMRVDPTTVSRRLRLLQERAGYVLFEQLRGGVRFTPAGLRLVAVAERIEQQLFDLDRHAAGEGAPLEGRLVVTLPEVLATAWVDCFTDFARTHPGIELVIGADDGVRNLSRREADVAVRWVDQPSGALVGRRVCRAAICAYGASDDAGLPWVRWPVGSMAEVATTAWRGAHAPEGRDWLEVDSMLVAVALATRGEAQIVLPCAAGDLLPGLRRMASPDAELGAWLWLLTHEELRSVPRVRAMLDHLDGWLSQRRGLLEGLG